MSVTALSSLQNYIHVRAVNRAGKPSDQDATCVASLTLDAPSCSYNVPNALIPSTGLVGAWGFDEMGDRVVSDSVTSTPNNESALAHAGTLIGGGDWRPGHDHGTPWTHADTNGYAEGTAGSLTFDGATGYVTTGPGRRHEQVLHRVRLGVSQADRRLPNRGLGHRKHGQLLLSPVRQGHRQLAFTLPSDDSSSPAAYYRAAAKSGSQVQLNAWTHLVGTYDASTGTIELYVNGVRQQSAAGKAWHASGPLIIGAAAGGIGDFFPGDIDSPQVWQRVLSARRSMTWPTPRPRWPSTTSVRGAAQTSPPRPRTSLRGPPTGHSTKAAARQRTTQVRTPTRPR
ncbi:LamG domain-containing protein [Kutzneria kofuensis]|uniref:LamG domain-containing protein n=1 Tax=Kutzneria kofuensis TaxID=103725 RepID=UPI0031ECFF08